MKKYIKYFVFVLSLFALVFCFPKTQSSFALNENLTVTASTQQVLIGNKQPIQFVATLSLAQNYDSSQIEWSINSSKINAGQGIDIDISQTDKSILTIDQNWTIFNQINSETTWTVSAKLTDDIFDSVSINFVFTNVSAVRIQPHGNTTQQMSDSMTDVRLVAEWDGYPQKTQICWYLKTSTNKYTKLSGNGVEYVFTPTQPGTFVFKASVNDVFSQTVTIKIKYKTITSLKLACHRDTENSTNLDRYTFTIENIDSNYDLDNIMWYSSQYGLMQEGGKTYSFQATSYETVNIYAVYTDSATNTKIESDYYPLEIKINRTKEVLIGCAILFGVMTVFLIVGCIRMKKRDRIW